MHGKRWYQRVASRVARCAGVRYFDLLYGEMALTKKAAAVVSDPALRVRRAEGAEVARLLQMLDGEERCSGQHAQAAGSRCYIAWQRDEVAGYTWCNTTMIDLLGCCVVRLGEDGCYSYNSYVFESYRGRKIFQAMIGHVAAEMRDEGKFWLANLVDPANEASVAARRRHGAQFQRARLLMLPGGKIVQVGKPFEMGITVNTESAKPADRTF